LLRDIPRTPFITIGDTPAALKLSLGWLARYDRNRAVGDTKAFNVKDLISNALIKALGLLTLKGGCRLSDIVAEVLELGVPRMALAFIDPVVVQGAFPIDRVFGAAVLNLSPEIVQAKEEEDGEEPSQALHPFLLLLLLHLPRLL
jgi:hypothetical protein